MPTKDLNEDITFFNSLGFRLDHIYPADDPAVAMMSGHGLHIRLDKDNNTSPPYIHLLTDQPELISDGKNVYTAPNGTLVELSATSKDLELLEVALPGRFETYL